jgi:aspartyl-tRNA(Asn)/glutamyl-tRNA(Gln) amidotransferase subunit C
MLKRKLSHEQVRHVAWLARLGLSEEEVEKFSLQLSDILENFEVLREVDTTNVPPATHIVPLRNVFREDVVMPSYPVSEILANAPRQSEDCFQIRPILE